ncbi:MAG: hypothetical protein FJ023_08450 [Chloroflexi bacterium]|nr:hypothetical protein [Chloroflexota bacterium]
MELPNVEVSGKFFVNVYGSRVSNWGIGIGADDSIPNEHSTIVDVKADGTFVESESWPFQNADKENTSWMIRVVGTTMIPEE